MIGSSNAATNARGHAAERTAVTAAAAVAVVGKVRAQQHRVDDLDHRGREICRQVQRRVDSVCLGDGRVDLRAALAAEEHDALIKGRKTLDLRVARAAVERLQGDAVEKVHVDGVVPAVKVDGLDVHKGVDQLGAAAAQPLRRTQNALRRGRGVKAQILNAILVAAG